MWNTENIPQMKGGTKTTLCFPYLERLTGPCRDLNVYKIRYSANAPKTFDVQFPIRHFCSRNDCKTRLFFFCCIIHTPRTRYICHKHILTDPKDAVRSRYRREIRSECLSNITESERKRNRETIPKVGACRETAREGET